MCKLPSNLHAQKMDFTRAEGTFLGEFARFKRKVCTSTNSYARSNILMLRSQIDRYKLRGRQRQSSATPTMDQLACLMNISALNSFSVHGLRRPSGQIGLRSIPPPLPPPVQGEGRERGGISDEFLKRL